MSDILPATAILEIEMEEPKPIQVAQIYDQEQNPINGRVYSENGIAPTLRTPTSGLSEPKIMQIGSYSPSSACNAKVLDTDGICPALLDHKGAEPAILTPIRTEEQHQLRKQGIDTFGGRQMLPRADGVSNTITTVQKDNLLQEPSILGYTRDDKGNVQSYHEKDVAGTIHTSSGNGGNTSQFVKTRHRIRKLTPTECLRLMDCDDEDIQKILDAQVPQVLKSGKVKYKPLPKTAAYKLAGNSICVAPLYYIFKAMFVDEPPRPKPIQESLFDI